MQEQNQKDKLGSLDVSSSFGAGVGNAKDTSWIKEGGEQQKQEKEKPQQTQQKQPESKKQGNNAEKKENFIIRTYDKHYKKLLLIPAAITILAFAILLSNYARTGEFFDTDVSIKGGVTITIPQAYGDLEGLQDFLTSSLGTAVNVRALSEAGTQKGIIIDASIQKDEEVSRLLSFLSEKLGALSEEQYSLQVIGSSLGASFFKSMITSIIIALLVMAVVVLVYFRIAAGKWTPMPSLFVMWTVIVDMVCTFAAISLLEVKLSTAGLAAFLMLIGYSVDTDILLTVRMLKGRDEKIFNRILGAAKTGIFMTLTGMAAVVAGLFLTQSDTIKQIMLVLAIGLAFDLIHTWITNTAILRWYMERNRYGTK